VFGIQIIPEDGLGLLLLLIISKAIRYLFIFSFHKKSRGI